MIKDTQELPLVTVRCITCNHVYFIKQCLDGIVMQQTNFRFEALIHDDASTDGTADIIREYANKYPDIIIPIIQVENQYSKRNGVITKVLNENTRGKYTALCEGDDFWTDPLKLQKQVDFLESHPEYSICFHNVDVIAEEGLKTDLYNHLVERDYSIDEVLTVWTIPTCSALIRSEVFKCTPRHKNFVVGDNVVFTNCARYGKLYCMNQKMAVYRRPHNSQTFTFSGSQFFLHFVALKECFHEFVNQFNRILIIRGAEVIASYASWRTSTLFK